MTGDSFTPGKPLCDTDGNLVAAHGGGMMFHNGTYYWYGESRESFHTFPGISCYSSRDLLSWKNEGRALLPVRDDPAHDLYYTNIIERPKVIYDAARKRFVMWMHVEDNRYQKACGGVAISDSPTGPFQYVRSMRPNGHEARDCSLYLDDDGRAYFIHSSEKNSTQHINLLTDDYLDFEGSFVRTWIHEWREAPAIFKHNGRYYSLTSLCTGFAPNMATYAMADSMLGEWRIVGNPCEGTGAECCFRSQVTYVQPVMSMPGQYLFMADRWTPSDLASSPYVWLPIDFEGERLRIRWSDRWNWRERGPSTYREEPAGPVVRAPAALTPSRTLEREPDLVLKRRIPDQERSALAWLDWKSGAIVATVFVVEETGSSLDGAGTGNDDPVDLWFDYFQVSLSAHGHAWKVVPCGSGNGDLSGIALTTRCLSPHLSCSTTKDFTTPHSSHLGLPARTRGTLYTVTVTGDALGGRAIDSGSEFAFALVLNNRDRTGKELKNRGYLPAGWRWGDTDTFHKLVLGS